MKETKIVQSYPSDAAIERTIREWQSFGWEMVSNQKYTDKEDLWFPGGTTVRTTTYNKLTFSREKNSRWYSEVKSIEDRYEGVQRDISAITSQKPTKKKYGYSCLDYVTLLLPIPFLSHFVYLIIKNVRYKKALKTYTENSESKIAELRNRGDDLRKKAAMTIERYESMPAAAMATAAAQSTGKRFCPVCGTAENTQGAKFCGKCGAPL